MMTLAIVSVSDCVYCFYDDDHKDVIISHYFQHVPKYLMRATRPAESETSAAPNEGHEEDRMSSGAQQS